MPLALLEGVALFTAVAATTYGWRHPYLVDWIDVANLLGRTAAVASCCIVAFYYHDLYDLRVVRSLGQFATRLVQSMGVALIFLAGLYALFPDARMDDGPFVSSLLMVLAVLIPLRALGFVFMRRRAFADRVLILGSGSLARTLIDAIESRPSFRFAIAGIADDALARPDQPLPYPLLGPLEHLAKIVDEVKANRIVVALEERRCHMPVGQLLDAETRGALVEDGLQTYESITGKLPIEIVHPSFLLFSRGFRKSRLTLALHRLISLTAAAIGFVVTAPLMVLIAIVVKLDSRGPALFIHERAGLRGRPFRLLKFRTMHELSLRPGKGVWSRDDSARITRVGRWLRKSRLDELPQLWNILRGDMDLVGPRPEMLENVKAMSEEIPYYSLRHSLRPGLTGWAQVRYGYSVSREQVLEKMRYDLFYVKHMCVWLDLRILADTVKIVLFGRGAQ